jgi:hypothetical protein
MSQIFVYSGEDIISSRKAFLGHLESLKKDNLEVLRMAGKDLTVEELALLSAPTSLFGEKRVLAIENLLSGVKSKEKEKIIGIVPSLPCPIVIWEGKDFTPAEQQKFSGFNFKNFKLPATMFHFLESIAPDKAKANLVKFQMALENADVNFLFLMLVRQVRLLILAKEKKDILKLPSWQKAKLQKQAAPFTEEALILIYKRLLQIDFQQKTSGSPYSLENLLELLLTEI